MRRKILGGLVVLLAVFVVGGVYVVVALESGASRLDELVRLHQVEILRENYLIQIKRVQSDLALRNTRYSRTFDTVVTDVVNMGHVVDTCFSCHHSPAGDWRLRELKDETDKYEEALSRVLTIRANASRLADEEDNAFRRGEALMGKVKDMIAMTSGRLGEKTQRSLERLSSTKYILYALFGISPLLAAGMAYLFLHGFGASVNSLREATEKLEAGDLDHRVAGLKDEFAEIGASFNRMAGSLKEQMRTVQRTEQMVILAELAAGLAREISGPLAGIKASMTDLSRQPRLSPEDRVVVQGAIEEIGWLENAMRGFLNFAKPQKTASSELNVNSLLEGTLAFCLKHRAPAPADRESVRIVKELCPLPATTADPVQLQQVFLNLFLEAFDAMPTGGVLGIRTSLDDSSRPIRVDISDTGNARAPRAKAPDLTMAISRLLIERQGGTIGEVKIPDGGTVVTLRLRVRPPGEETAS